MHYHIFGENWLGSVLELRHLYAVHNPIIGENMLGSVLELRFFFVVHNQIFGENMPGSVLQLEKLELKFSGLGRPLPCCITAEFLEEH